MSATIEVNKYAEYFRRWNPKYVTAKGSCYPVETLYYEHILTTVCATIRKGSREFHQLADSPELNTNQIMLCMDILHYIDMKEVEIRNQNPDYARGAVVIFLPGLAEINEVRQNIRRHLMNSGCGNRYYKIYRLHSALPRNKVEMDQIMGRPEPGVRKIILSTNVAESSITISDARYIIDFCLTKFLEKDKETNLSQLKMKWASKDMCNQRKGRAGRTQEGTCYRLCRESFFEHQLNENIPPEIERCPLEKCVLLGKGVFPEMSPMQFLHDACAKPTEEDVGLAIKTLKEIGALTLGSKNERKMDINDGDMTPVGSLMNRLPLDLAHSKLIFLGYTVGLTMEAVIIAACMQSENFWNYTKELPDEEKDHNSSVNSLRSKMYWAEGSKSDHIAMLNAFRSWYSKMPKDFKANYFMKKHRMPHLAYKNRDKQLLEDVEKEKAWCQDYGLNTKALRQSHLYVHDIIRRLRDMGYQLGDDEIDLDEFSKLHRSRAGQEKVDQTRLLKFIIAGAAYPFYYKYTKIDQEEELRNSNNFNPFTTVYFKGAPPHGNYKYGLSLYNWVKGCGPIKRVYFDDTRIFIEFDAELDKYSILQHLRTLESYDLATRYDRSNEILPAVLLALKSGKKKSSETSIVWGYPSEDLIPQTGVLQARFFHWLCFPKIYQTKFPNPKLHHPKSYRIESKYCLSFHY